MEIKSESILSWVPEKSDKNITHLVGDQILKFLSPTDKITRFCEWASGYETLVLSAIHMTGGNI